MDNRLKMVWSIWLIWWSGFLVSDMFMVKNVSLNQTVALFVVCILMNLLSILKFYTDPKLWFNILNKLQDHSWIVKIDQAIFVAIVCICYLTQLVLIVQIAQHMHVSIRQFLCAGDPTIHFYHKTLVYSTFQGSLCWQLDGREMFEHAFLFVCRLETPGSQRRTARSAVSVTETTTSPASPGSAAPLRSVRS